VGSHGQTSTIKVLEKVVTGKPDCASTGDLTLTGKRFDTNFRTVNHFYTLLPNAAQSVPEAAECDQPELLWSFEDNVIGITTTGDHVDDEVVDMLNDVVQEKVESPKSETWSIDLTETDGPGIIHPLSPSDITKEP